MGLPKQKTSIKNNMEKGEDIEIPKQIDLKSINIIQCEHGYKQQCEKCKYEKCEHGKRSSDCIYCDGMSYCEHGKRMCNCIDCGGSAYCEHGIKKYNCIDCGGSAYCKHGKKKIVCKECGGSALCKSELCETYGNKKYEGYCMRCYIHIYPDKPNSRNYKTKERAVIEKVMEKYPDYDWVNDKKVIDGCSRRRPDLLLDMGSHIIIIEVDENKHTDYDCMCEHRRLMEISQDLQHRPIIFIRFNPDAYLDTNNNLIKSCWKINHLGIMVIYDINDWNGRIAKLLDEIQYWMNNNTEKTIEIIELFY